MEDLAYSPKQFCKVAGFSLSRLYKSWRDGKGPPYFKLGSRTVIPVDSARRWLQEQAEAAGREPSAGHPQTPARARAHETGSDHRPTRKAHPRRSEVAA